jgi:Crp-like helix-turn-helix domain
MVARRAHRWSKKFSNSAGICARYPYGPGLKIPLTQESIGQMLGVRRTTVTIAARLLQTAGLIRYRRGLIQILDRRALEDMSCECYAIVTHNADNVSATCPVK